MAAAKKRPEKKRAVTKTAKLNVKRTTSAEKRARPKTPSGFADPVGPQQLQTAAKSALSMVKTIVEFLPINGEAESKSDINVIDQWFQTAGEDYTTFERLRNPRRLPWPGPGSFHVASPSPKSCPYFQELCKAMARVCQEFSWQGISDGSRIPHSMQRHGTALIPPIDTAVLRGVAVAAQGLLEDLDPADIDGRQLVASLTPQPHGNLKRTPARPSHSPELRKKELIELMDLNGNKNQSRRSLSRIKKEWKAEPVPNTHSRKFRFRLATLRAKNVRYPSEWDTPLG